MTIIMKIPYNVKNNTESENVKTLLAAKGTPGQVEDFYILSIASNDHTSVYQGKY